MNITLELLKKLHACEEALAIFQKEWKTGIVSLSNLFSYLDNERKDNWTNWLFRNLLGDINENLVHFKGCKNLTYIYLSSTQISDAGLAHFTDCKNLRALYLNNTQISNIGLTHFKDCKNLTTLYLHDTQVSDAGLTHYKEVCPYIRIYI